MHRARYLAQQLIAAGDDTKRVLVATYTRSLASNLDRTLRTFCTPDQYRALHVSTVDALAQQVLASTDQRLRPVQADELEELAREAVAMTGLDELNLDYRFLIAEWEQVVLARNINTLPDYAMAPRPGRGVRLSRGTAQAGLVGDRAPRRRPRLAQARDLRAARRSRRRAPRRAQHHGHRPVRPRRHRRGAGSPPLPVAAAPRVRPARTQRPLPRRRRTPAHLRPQGQPQQPGNRDSWTLTPA